MSRIQADNILTLHHINNILTCQASPTGNSFGNSVFSVDFEEGSLGKTLPLFGAKYNFHLTEVSASTIKHKYSFHLTEVGEW